MKKNNIFEEANLYSAYLEGRTSKEEDAEVMKRMLCDTELVMILNLAGAACS